MHVLETEHRPGVLMSAEQKQCPCCLRGRRNSPLCVLTASPPACPLVRRLLLFTVSPLRTHGLARVASSDSLCISVSPETKLLQTVYALVVNAVPRHEQAAWCWPLNGHCSGSQLPERESWMSFQILSAAIDFMSSPDDF